MTNDTLHRIYTDGTERLIGFCQEFYLADDPAAEQAVQEHNRQFYRLVPEHGLA